MIRASVATLLALLALAPAACAIVQDASSYPPGVHEVSNSPVQADSDFRVTIRTDLAEPTVGVYVCHFTSMAAEAPDECYLPVTAAAQGGAFVADTKGRQHPAWQDGWVLGYKVTIRAGDDERHAPDRTTSAGDPDYYRVVVGSAQGGAAPQGSAEVDDDPLAAGGPAAQQAAPHTAGLAPLSALLAVACAAALARRR